MSPLAALRDLRALARVYRGGSPGPTEDSPAARVAVVLGAEVLPGGRPSGTLEARAWHAARLYARGEVGLLIPTGGVGEHPPSEAEVMMGMLRVAGVPEQDVLLEDEARNTWGSARLVAGMARKRGIERVRVVTDPLHCVRAVGAFRKAGLAARAEPVYGSPMWREPAKRRGQLAREIGAILWYGIRHRTGSRSRR